MHDWKGNTLADVNDNGQNYLYSLAYDYEKYVQTFGYIPMNLFITDWTCIRYDDFDKLRPGDFVYSSVGTRYKIIDYPFLSDDETTMYVEACRYPDDNTVYTSTDMLTSGDIYFDSVIHKDFRHRRIRKRKEREELLCPILITKTNQPQN